MDRYLLLPALPDEEDTEMLSHIAQEAGFALIIPSDRTADSTAAIRTGIAQIRERSGSRCAVVLTRDPVDIHHLQAAAERALCSPDSLLWESLPGGRALLGLSGQMIPSVLQGELCEDAAAFLEHRRAPVRPAGTGTPSPGKERRRAPRQLVKFAASSLTGFVTDYSLYTLLTFLSAALSLPTALSLTLSNILARIVSAAVNFTINQHLVFHSEGETAKKAAGYFSLAACILAGNTVLLNVLVRYAQVDRFLAKLVTEVTFFSLSWLVQKLLIFRRRPGTAQPRSTISAV